MQQVFVTLTKAIEGSAHVALVAAFVWGVLSVVLSPCHLASIPLIIGFISEQGRLTVRRAFGLSALFALGILVTIAVVGVITASMGRVWGDLGRTGNYTVAVVFFIVGLHLIGLIPMPFSVANASGFKSKGFVAAFLLGLVFGVAIGPCTFAYMMPVLAVSFRAAATNLLYGIALMTLYGVGHCSVIVAAGTFTEAVERYLNWNERSQATQVIRAVCGVLVILGGFYLIWKAL